MFRNFEIENKKFSILKEKKDNLDDKEIIRHLKRENRLNYNIVNVNDEVKDIKIKNNFLNNNLEKHKKVNFDNLTEINEKSLKSK